LFRKSVWNIFRLFFLFLGSLPSYLGAQPASLQSALLTSASALGINLVYRAEIPLGISTQCVQLQGKAEQVLSCLLQNTGLQFRKIGHNTYLIEPAKAGNLVRPPLPSYTLFGSIREVGTGKALPQATVWLAENQQRIILDKKAGFSVEGLSLPRYALHVRLLGYEPLTIQVRHTATHSDSLHIWIKPLPLEVLPVIIEGKQGHLWLGENEVADETRLAIRGFGTADVLQSTATLNGVYMNDARGEVHIQGGESGEHLIRLDEMPVFEPLQLRGIVSTFSPFAVGQMTLHKAGFGVEEGSALAGVMAFEHNLRLPENQNHVLETQLDHLSLNARWAMRQENKGFRAKLMLSARIGLGKMYQSATLSDVLQNWSHPDEFLPFAAIVQRNPLFFETARALKKPDLAAFGQTKADFNDLHGAGRWDWGNGHALQAAFYIGWNTLSGNALTTDTTSQVINRDFYRWGNGAGRVSWRYSSPKGILRTVTMIAATYRLTHAYNYLANLRFIPIVLPDGTVLELRDDPVPADDGNRYQEVWLQAKWTALRWTLGAEGVYAVNRVGLKHWTTQTVDMALKQPRWAAYGTYSHRIGTYTTLESGFRGTWLMGKGVYPEPRFTIRLLNRPAKYGSFSGYLSFGIFRQFIQQFEYSSFSPSALLPSLRFWIPVSDRYVPYARHFTARLDWKTGLGLELGGEVYQKKLRNLRVLDYGQLWALSESHQTARQIEALTGFALGEAAGFGLELKGRTLMVEMVIRYDYARAFRTLKPVAEVRQLVYTDVKPVAWSEPGRWLFATKAAFATHWKWTLNGRISKGRLWAFRKAYYDYLTHSGLEAVFGTYNLQTPETHALPLFMQWDTGISYTRTLKKTTAQARVELLNVLDRKNVAEWWFERPQIGLSGYEYRLQERTLTPFIPAVSLRFDF